jgi:4-hydroxy-tetrahydrodipicolinate synthase
VFVGSEAFLLRNMRHGGVGTISATANVNPAAIHKLYLEWNGANADNDQAGLDAVRAVFARQTPMIAALKQAIAIYRKDPQWARVRPPLVELTKDKAATLEAELGQVGFEMTVET